MSSSLEKAAPFKVQCFPVLSRKEDQWIVNHKVVLGPRSMYIGNLQEEKATIWWMGGSNDGDDAQILGAY